LTQSEIDASGWSDGSFRIFTCANPPFGRAAQIDVAIYRFRVADSAVQARPYFAGTYGLEAAEVRNCVAAGELVFCVTAHCHAGSPLSDIQFVLQHIVGSGVP
jgi:hypothetical protein